MNKIKLVIWDMDETFWKGTLSEGKITPINENIEIVKKLSYRGIINSISSKNDFNDVKKKLEDLGVWEFFVFPSIDWSPKGQNIKHIIDKCQLRAPNVLFIDDNIINLKEAEFFNKDINTADVSIIPQLLNLDELKGKNDSRLSRLNQYKVLEKKYEARKDFSNNIDFLRQSKIELFYDAANNHVERVLELINRTNQLNFTKIRLTEEELKNLLNDSSYKCRVVHVKDAYGDYGICGFYALDRKQNALLHFVFSCRAMNLGIEQYVYMSLHKPGINIVPEVASDLNQYEIIDWISESDANNSTNEIIESKRKPKILFLGGCDLEQLCHYLDYNRLEVLKDFNYPSIKFYPIHREHTIYLREYDKLDEESKRIIYELPFADEKIFDMHFLKDNYDILVYSPLMNYTHEIYKHKAKGFKIAYGGYLNKEKLIQYLRLTGKDKRIFEDNFEFEGLQTTDSFKEDLRWLIKRVNKPIYFLNGAEVDTTTSSEPQACQRHKEMNNALEEVVKEFPKQCKIIDVRQYVKEKEDIRDSIRHYQRPIYMKLSACLMSSIFEETVNVPISNRIKIWIKQLIDDCKKKLFSKSCPLVSLNKMLKGFLNKLK